MRATTARPAAAAAVAVLLSGCAAAGPGTPGTASPSDAPVPASYYCHEVPVPAEVLDDGAPATELGEHGRAALDGLDVPELDLTEWVIVRESDSEVYLLRELAEPEDLGAGDVRSHELLGITIVDAPNLPGSPAWMLTRAATCAIARDVGDLGYADVTLDPAHPPSAGAREIALLVTERACNSGEDATGRVVLVETTETASVVAVVVGVEPRSGNHTCPMNPPTPFVVSLDEALGDRQILNAAVVPPRELALD